jgi:xylulokinase
MGEACILLDRAERPIGNIIAWFDRRTEPIAQELERTIGAERLFAITGLALDPTFTLCKLLWLRAQEPEAAASARRVLNVADWLAFRLSGEAATDFSLASRTLCLDLGERAWSREIVERTGIDATLLPPIRPSGWRLGPIRAEILETTGLAGRPVVGVGAHDHVCGSFAAGATRPGVLLDSMGTAESLLLPLVSSPTGEATRRSGYVMGAMMVERPLAYLGGAIYSSGGTIEWLRKLLAQSAPHDSLIGPAADLPPGADGIVFLPHLAYSAAPHVDIAARGAYVGLTLSAERPALYRAMLDGLALEARQVVDGMLALPGVPGPEEIRVIGGSTRNALWMRIKAAAFRRALTVIDEPEATATGAAMLGGIAAGLWNGLDDALQSVKLATQLIDPDPLWIEAYDVLYRKVYQPLYPALAPINHALAETRAVVGRSMGRSTVEGQRP